MSQFLANTKIKIGETEYSPENGVITVPDECDGIAVNRLGLTKLVTLHVADAAEDHE